MQGGKAANHEAGRCGEVSNPDVFEPSRTEVPRRGRHGAVFPPVGQDRFDGIVKRGLGLIVWIWRRPDAESRAGLILPSVGLTLPWSGIDPCLKGTFQHVRPFLFDVSPWPHDSGRTRLGRSRPLGREDRGRAVAMVTTASRPARGRSRRIRRPRRRGY